MSEERQAPAPPVTRPAVSRSESALVAEVRRALGREGLAAAGMVVAVSGGPDSVALLRALLLARSAPTPLVVAHLNHRLRGAESDADQDFVRGLHARLAVEYEN